MPVALTKAEIAAHASTRGQPISGALARTILTITGGCQVTVDVALDAAQTASADVALTKVIGDAVHSHQIDILRAMAESEQAVVALAHFGVGTDLEAIADLQVLPDLNESPPRDAGSILDGAVASGVLTVSATALPDVDRALTEVLGPPRMTAILTRLLEYRCKTDTLDDITAVKLVRAGIKNPELANFLQTAASAAAPESAVVLYDYAVAAGADDRALAAQRGETAAVLGDLASAQNFCDTVLENFDSVGVRELRTAVRISATIAAESGMASRSAALFTWLGAERAGADSDIGVATCLVAADRAAADAMSTRSSAAPPTASGASLTLLAEGLRQSIDATSTAETTAAANTLMRAVSLSTNPARRVSPDSAAATAILLALHGGDLAHAESISASTLASLPVRHHQRHRIALLQAWTTMLSGDLVAALARADALQIPQSHSRDQLFLHGIRVGLARRSGDSGSLTKAWEDAQDIISRYSVDLLSFLPVGELWLGAVRVGQPERLSHLLAQADAVRAGLNEPHAWTSALHWYGVQAAIQSERPADLVPHAQALAEAAESNQYSAVLAAAGRAWLAVLQGRPEVAEVEAAAHSLARVGHSWDGARLASEAALRVGDTRAATTLLHVARSLRQPAAAPVSVAASASAEIKGSLSAREAEVAELLVLGVTYREAGARLYISAKTVEHHVARIRRRLGAGSRSELLSMLRAMGYGTGSPDL
ncbi:LuxR C-terminal-related transcriptional regulator [Rhodococcus sp. G-MC3]|uniref:LuxR C-terminal-related transcriptional regulator n=1 Tax=Rhodococcus sp. G-MC3 TaxID=3046209 RepID=UPI0024BA02AC|nr:LuxR C-terminal-related transcriptional regulator [Rhodococcus sp. G-MC3]MDJ0395291.1 LuxR C-terminal-related transcriptional regulator [Rhodococcus sp. G-MC3]